MALYSRESCCCCCSRLPALVLSCWLDAIRRGAILDWSGRYITVLCTHIQLPNWSSRTSLIISSLCCVFLFLPFGSFFLFFFWFLWRFPSRDLRFFAPSWAVRDSFSSSLFLLPHALWWPHLHAVCFLLPSADLYTGLNISIQLLTVTERGL